MKHKFSKILATICCAALLCSVFSFFASAHTFNTDPLYAPHGGDPVVENYQWETISKIVSTEQMEKYFVMHTETNAGHKEDLYLSFPQAAGGFRLQSKHEYQKAVEASHIGLFEPETVKITYMNTDGAVVMKATDGTTVKYIQNGTDFRLDIYNGTILTMRIENGQIHFGYSQKKRNYDKIVATLVEMPMDYENEAIYNGGQRYCDTNVVGEHFSLSNNDCFSAEDYAYGNIPLFHSNRGYSIWFNMTYPGEANFGCDRDETVSKEKYSLLFYGDKLDFFMWTGEPLENLKKYTRITGTSGMTEEWTFGFWTGATGEAWSGGDGAQANVESVMEGYKTRYGFYPEAVYSEGAFANTESAAYLSSIGVRNLDWIWGMSKQFPTDLADVSKLPVAGSTGWPLPFSTLGLNLGNYYVSVDSEYADASNPSFVSYLKNYFTRKMWSFGASGSMLDMNESMSFVGTCFNGLSSMEMHNLNSYYYAKYASELWAENYTGAGNDYVLFQRSAAAGTQYYVAGFQGDQKSNWDGYKAAIRDMISRAAGGFNLYGADLGGLSGKPSNDLWNRWVIFSVFQPYMRQHGTVIHKPWEYGEISEKNFGNYYYLRKNIVPSVMSAAIEANRTSNPIVKGMMMAYPKELSLKDIDTQYLFCEDFLVCAVTTNDVTWLDVTLPEGNTWYNIFSYEALAGKKGAQSVTAPNNWMPVYLKDGSVKAINLPESKTLMDEMADDTDENPSLLITPPDAGNGRQTVIYNKKGNSSDFRMYDYTTETYVSTPVDNATFTVTNKDKEGSSRQTVLALGVIAYEVYVDGEKLTAQSNKAALTGGNYGYHVDANGLTTIYLPDAWKELKVVKGNALYNELPNKTNYTGNNSQTADLFDGDYANGLPTSGNAFRFDVKSSQQIDRIEIYWNPNYAKTYTIEVSKNSQYIGYSTVFTTAQCEGDGGIDICDISATGRYIRITPKTFSSNVKGGEPVVQEIKIYKKDGTVTKMTAGTAVCANGHTYGDSDICANCGYERTSVEEWVTGGRYFATVKTEGDREVKVGTLLFTNMKGERAVPVRVGFQQNATGAPEYTVPTGFDAEGVEVSYKTITPTLENPNIGHLGNSFNTTLGGLRCVSRFTRVAEGGADYLLLSGKKYEVVDYGMLVAAQPGLDVMPQLSTEQAMVFHTVNPYVKALSAKAVNKVYDKCDAYIDVAVTLVNMDRVEGYETMNIYSRAYVAVKADNGETLYLYGNIAVSNYASVIA